MRSRIMQMKRITHQIDELNGQLGALSRPRLTDYGLLPYIWSEFVEFCKKNGKSPAQVYERQKFLYVVLLLYCPQTLIGRKLKGGLRKALSEEIGVKGESISDNIRNVVIIYNNYGDFSRDVDYFYDEISEKLGAQRPSGGS